MKKLVALMMVLVMAFALAACGGPKKSEDPCVGCGDETAYIYEIEEFGEISYCKDCYKAYTEAMKAIEDAMAQY